MKEFKKWKNNKWQDYKNVKIAHKKHTKNTKETQIYKLNTKHLTEHLVILFGGQVFWLG